LTGISSDEPVGGLPAHFGRLIAAIRVLQDRFGIPLLKFLRLIAFFAGHSPSFQIR